jgi:steroid delta-isomerase-like uncharacterized protein
MANDNQREPAIVRTVRHLFTRVLDHNDLDAADELLTEDFSFDYPLPGFGAGPRGFKQFVSALHEGFPDLAVTIEELWGNESRAAIRFTMRGTHDGTLFGVSATGRRATIRAIGIYGPGGGGRIREGFLSMDTAGMLEQTDVIRPIAQLLPGLGQR